jgi:hypothetical protein
MISRVDVITSSEGQDGAQRGDSRCCTTAGDRLSKTGAAKKLKLFGDAERLGSEFSAEVREEWIMIN